MFDTMSRKAAASLANSFLLARGKRLYEQNTRNVWMPLGKVDKVLAGAYIILEDYAAGKFPPKFEDQAATYLAEINYHKNLPGVDQSVADEGALRKPFWGPDAFEKYASGFTQLWRVMLSLEIKPGDEVLELGCGSGWMAEFLANAGYKVTGTTISDIEVGIANKRIPAVQAKGGGGSARFVAAPMESVTDALPPGSVFDCVFIFEALHHAFDWKQTIHTSFKAVKPGGWLILANEPNLMHTFISYRVGKLTNTHEIGMSQSELVSEMQKAGFVQVEAREPKLNNLVSDHWIVGRRPK